MAFGNVTSAQEATLELISLNLALKITGTAEPEIIKGLADVGSYHAVLGFAVEEFLEEPTDARFAHLEGIFTGDIDAEQWAKSEGWI